MLRDMLTERVLEEALKAFEGTRVAILGDFYLDRYIIGTVETISREAPIPIVQIEKDTYSPGAAGNTALNVCDLGVQTYVVSVIGEDVAGEIMQKEFAKRGVDTSGMIVAADRHTPTYNKIYASAFHGQMQQVARFDRENKTGLSPKVEDLLIEQVERTLDEMDAIVVQDQTEVRGTGVITDRVIQTAARRKDKITVGDSRNRLTALKGLTAVVPNEYEGTVAAGVHKGGEEEITDEMVNQAGHRLLDILGSQYAMITRGEKGTTVFSKDKAPVLVPTVPAEGEIDVTGAGDTMTAAVAAGMAAGLSAEQAVALGNLGAGITVKKIGTTGTALPDELRAALRSRLQS